MSVYFPNAQGTNSSLSNPAFWVGAIIATLGVFQPWSKTTLTKQGLVIWQPRDKYPPDKVTAVKVKKEMWHDYCVIIESELEKRKVSGTLYIEQAEQVQKLIHEFLDQNKADAK
ncbi:MAG: hypothetical protein KF836_09265 [Fimbriimonadaceae bacterium]|nr:hypothetical protein [Fimbriimonadaceae bacterium]